MEFKDIKNFASKDTKTYEDDANFCKERFADAEMACEMLFFFSYEKLEYSGVNILVPVEDNVKLNAFKKYAKEANEDMSILTDSEWKTVSTPEMY